MSLTMYSLKPIIKSVEIEYPTCMYGMKNLQTKKLSGMDSESGNNNDAGVSLPLSSLENLDKRIYEQIQTILKRKLPEMEALEIRQQNILQQLDELRKQIQLMNKDLNLCAKPAQSRAVSTVSTQTALKPIQTTYLQDVVINVNPKFIPYSLLALKKLWANRLHLNFLTFIHSSVPEISKEAQAFANEISKDAQSKSDIPSLKISLIWKNVGTNSELNCSAIMYVPVYGEVNILRYLARIGPNEFNHENNARVNEIDIILDTCYQVVNESTLKTRQNYLRVLSSRLGKSFYYGGETVTIADIAVYSILRQNLFATKDLSQNLNKFVQNVTAGLQ